MKPIFAVFVFVLLVKAGYSDEPARQIVKPVPREAPFRAYWLAPADDKKADYLHLLVTHGPIEDLAGHRTWSHHPLDNMAMTFRTYRHDSLWDNPFVCVKHFGKIESVSSTVIIDDATYHYEDCPLTDVVRLLEKPLGSLPISRISNPLEGAEQTAKAFQLLLKEQLKATPANN